ncbi:hypothetical protein Afil01_47590 [Actinorhabdospora filicis]|uniref:AcrB/AcrD/AcrF family protein n=1 Tax=Actinorhabdospora filicis TaxID=1785913 RepID=A0A9W6SQD4_9ACTN|nr:hypothetical protein Afil01_47590 [Actinorhabdospora filicis]
MSFLTRWSLANRGLVALITLVLAGFAAYATPNLKQQLIPSMSFPMVSVIAAYPGAAPDIVESEVTTPIEDALRGVDGIKEVISTSSESRTNVRVRFDFGADIDRAQAEVQQALAKAKLPDDVDPQTFVGSTDDMPIIQLAATSGLGEDALTERLNAKVVPELEGIPGVKEVSVGGAREKVVTITADTAALARKGLTLQAIGTAVQGAGRPFPVGAVTADGSTLTIQAGDA